MTGGFSSTAYYHRFAGRAAALRWTRAVCYALEALFHNRRFIARSGSTFHPFLVPIFLSVHNPLRLSYEPVRWEAPVTLQGLS